MKVGNIDCDENFKCTVKINFENFTFTNKQGYDTKKEATRKTYLEFGLALGILEPATGNLLRTFYILQYIRAPYDSFCLPLL